MSVDGPRGAPLRRGISIRLAGEAVHGLLFTGYVLAEAALLDRRSVSHAPTLGEGALGPLSGGALRIGADPGEYPLVEEPDLLLLTSAPALARFASPRPAEGRVLVEESLAPLAPAFAISLPLVRTALAAGGTALVVDLVAAAVVAQVTGGVSRRSLLEAAELLLPQRGRPAGLAALDAGMELGRSRVRAA